MVRRLSSPSGFSLIELLVVILIVGLLATVMIPRFLGQRDSSNDAAARSNLRNAVSAVSAYYLQNETFPAGSDSSGLNDLADFVCTSEPGLSVAGRCGALAGSTGGPPTTPASCAGSMCTPGSSADPNRVFLTTGPNAGKSNYATVCNVSRGALQQCVRLNGGGAAAWANSAFGLGVAAAIGASGQNYRSVVLNTSGLVAYWPLDESSGTSAQDLKGGSALTYGGPPTLGAAALISDVGSAVTFPGGSASAATAQRTTNPSVLSPATASFEAWLRLPASLGSSYSGFLLNAIVLSGTAPGWRIAVQTNAAGTQVVAAAIVRAVTNAAATYLPQATLGFSQTYHVVLTVSGTQAVLYLNGATAASATLPAAYAGGSSVFQIGGCPGCSPTFTLAGTVDEAAVYGRALSASEVQAHYQAGL